MTASGRKLPIDGSKKTCRLCQTLLLRNQNLESFERRLCQTLLFVHIKCIASGYGGPKTVASSRIQSRLSMSFGTME